MLESSLMRVPGGIAESGMKLPLLESFPQHVSQKGDQNMRLDAILVVMPDRTDA
jgi:hypothetical protein